MWFQHRDITPEGAVLVRPDRFVAWRSAGTAADPVATLGAAMARIVGRVSAH